MLKYLRRILHRARWSRFTDRARATMVLANRKAHEAQSPRIGEEHVQAAIAEKRDGVGAALLRYVGIRLAELRSPTFLVLSFTRPRDGELLKLPWDVSVKRVVRQAIEDAITLDDNHVGTEHLVLGLSRGKSEALLREMAACGITADGLRDSLRALTHFREATTAHAGGKWREAVAEYRRTLRFKPDDRVAANNLAWVLATCPNDGVRSGNEALKLTEWVASGVATSAWNYQGTLAAAYAEVGQFEEATKWGTRAMELAAGADEGRWQIWLAGFRERQPVREGVRVKKESTT